MFGARFYNGLTRKYTACFGTLFNDILIDRDSAPGVPAKTLRVPIAFGPTQKFLHRRLQDEEHKAQAIELPRMAFELVNYAYDGTRNLTQIPHNRRQNSEDGTKLVNLMPAPYNLDFELYVMANKLEDGLKILEQILPYFKPHFTLTAKLIDGVDQSYDIPVVLNSVSRQDDYEGGPEERRTIVWTLTFTMKAWFFGPTTERKVIKFTDVRTYTNAEMKPGSHAARMTVQPGMTEEGEPTTDLSETVPYTQIEEDDDWAYIVVIE